MNIVHNYTEEDEGVEGNIPVGAAYIIANNYGAGTCTLQGDVSQGGTKVDVPPGKIFIFPFIEGRAYEKKSWAAPNGAWILAVYL